MRAAREYAKTPKLTFRVDPFTPAAFEARLALEREHTAQEHESGRHDYCRSAGLIEQVEVSTGGVRSGDIAIAVLQRL